MNNTEENHYKKIYKGLSYEQYTISRLCNKGYEAHKANADFGLDITASNIYSNADIEPKTYVFQVKSRYIKKEYIKEKIFKAGTRKTLFISFALSQNAFEKLLRQSNAYLVCYIAEQCEDGSENIWGEFWLSSKQLHFLEEQEYIKFNTSKPYTAYINTYITTQADLHQKVFSCFEQIDTEIKALEIPEDAGLNIAIQELKKIIQKTPLLNVASNTNIYITKSPNDEHGKLCLSPWQHHLQYFDMDNIPESPFY